METASPFWNTVGLFPTSLIIFTLSLIVNFFLFNAMAIHCFKVTFTKITTLRCNTKFPADTGDKEWAETAMQMMTLN